MYNHFVTPNDYFQYDKSHITFVELNKNIHHIKLLDKLIAIWDKRDNFFTLNSSGRKIFNINEKEKNIYILSDIEIEKRLKEKKDWSIDELIVKIEDIIIDLLYK